MKQKRKSVKDSGVTIAGPEHPWEKLLKDFIASAPDGEKEMAKEFCRPFQDAIKPEALNKLN